MAANSWILFLFAVSAAAQVAPDQKAPASLEGRVIHSATGEAVRKAHVMLEPGAAGHEAELVATTDDTGRFRFANITPGLYRLTAEKNGLIGGGYGEAKPRDRLTLLRVGAGDKLQDLTLRLFPAAAISGRVFDADGDPAAGQHVMIWTKSIRDGQSELYPAGDATTDQAGEYRVDNLSKGSFYASDDPRPWDPIRRIPVDREGNVTKLHELATFFPAAVSIADAQAIHIEDGQEQSGIDIRIQRGPTLSVKGRIAGMTNSARDTS